MSGHSIRVGATQDLLALNIDLASVMQAGRWKTHRMPMRYGEHVLAARGGMARLAAAQGTRPRLDTSNRLGSRKARPILRNSRYGNLLGGRRWPEAALKLDLGDPG